MILWFVFIEGCERLDVIITEAALFISYCATGVLSIGHLYQDTILRMLPAA